MLGRLIEWNSRVDGDTYTTFEMMDDLRNAIWSELDSNSEVNVYRRNLQRAYVERMEYLMTEEPSVPPQFAQYFDINVDVSQSDIRPIVRDQLQQLLQEVKRSQGQVNDRATRVHLADVEQRIQNVLNPDD
jgi:hypothetical protein